MLPMRFRAGLLPVQATATNTARSKPTSSAACGAVKQSNHRAMLHSKAAADAAETPRCVRLHSTSRQQRTAAVKAQQQQQQQRRRGLSQHLDKLVPAPYQGLSGDLVFTGQLRYAYTQKEARAALAELLQLADACSSSRPLVVGFDTETAVTWGARQQDTPTSLMQLCYHAAGHRQPVCLLLALHTLGLGGSLLRVLQHPHILKVGIGIAHDMLDLLRTHEVDCTVPGMLDLSWLATQCGVNKKASPRDAARLQEMQACGIKTFQQPLQWGLAGLLQRTSEFTLRKSKRITMSNWSKNPLSEQQLQYAACDAYAGLIAFHTLWLVWLQQQPAATAAKIAPANLQQRAFSSSSSSSSSGFSSRGDTLGSPTTTAEEVDGLLNWLLDSDQQQQLQQNELYQKLTTVAATMPAEPQPATDINLGSGSPTLLGSDTASAAVGAVPADDATGPPQPDSTRSLLTQFTVQKRYLTDAGFWRSYEPAAQRQQRWQQLLQRGTTAAQLQYDSMVANVLDKAGAGDSSDFDRAVPWLPVADAAAEAAAGGLLWP